MPTLYRGDCAHTGTSEGDDGERRQDAVLTYRRCIEKTVPIPVLAKEMMEKEGQTICAVRSI